MRFPLLVTMVLLLGGAAPAGAATIVEEPTRSPCSSGDKFCSPGPPTAVFVGAPGEANRLQVTVDAMGILLRDALPITAAPAACTTVDASAVRCPGGTYWYEVQLGDGDDVAEVTSAPGRGGPRLEGGPGADLLTAAYADGGPGDDTLIVPAGLESSSIVDLPVAGLDGGPGADRLLGAAAPSVGLTGGPGPDLLDGGAAEATADYGDSPAGVRVALGGQVGGGDADGDVLQGIEHVYGSPFADVLTGDAGANQLWGDSPYSLGRGHDTIDGGDGNDELTGSGGRDTLTGGAGDDTVTGKRGADRVTGDAGKDRVSGGGGVDRVDGGDGDDVVDLADGNDGEVVACGAGADVAVALRDVLGDDCERVDASRLVSDATMPARPVRMGGGRVALAVPCRPSSGQHCELEVILRARGHVVARERVRLRPGTRRVALVVPGGGLQRLDALGVTVRDRGRYSSPSDRVAYTVHLRDTR